MEPAKRYSAPTSACVDLAYAYLDIERDEDAQQEKWQAEVAAWQRRRDRGRARAQPRDDPKPKKPLRTSLRAFAAASPYDESSIRKHLKSLKVDGKPNLSDRPAGRPRLLLDWEDELIVNDILERGAIPVSKSEVVEAANRARALRGQSAVGKHWFERWMAIHPELNPEPDTELDTTQTAVGSTAPGVSPPVSVSPQRLRIGGTSTALTQAPILPISQYRRPQQAAPRHREKMAPLKITLDGVKIAVTAQPLHGATFAPFGEVIQNPRPDVHPSQFEDAGPLPLHAVPANQGSAIKYQHVTKMVNRYGQAPSGKPGSAVMNMFVCAARRLQTQPSRSHGTVSSSRVFEVKILERHPYTSQTFSPLSTTGSRDINSKEGYLVIVAPRLERPSLPSSIPAPSDVGLGHDKPDLTQLKAFIATTDQAVTYGAGTWHAPMVALGPEESTVSFIVTQFTNGVGNEDCKEVVLESPNGDGHVLIELPQSSNPRASRRAQVDSNL